MNRKFPDAVSRPINAACAGRPPPDHKSIQFARRDQQPSERCHNLSGTEGPENRFRSLPSKPEPVAKHPRTDNSATPELAMQGYCPVTVIKKTAGSKGNPKLGVIHLGKLYLFADSEKMQTFLADPVPYTPVLNEIDVVRFFEERRDRSRKTRMGPEGSDT